MKKTREQYLNQAVKELAKKVFKPAGIELPPVNVSCSWPGGRGNKNSTIGQCWVRAASSAGVNEVFISPTIDNSVRCLDILAHELIHAVDDCKNGHRAPFVRMARDIGLVGKPTSTKAGDELTKTLEGIVKRIGEYPHKKMNVAKSGIKKQGTRMLKLSCNDCGAVWRMSKTHAVNVVTCPCCPSDDIKVG
jgi:hypothetical protein